MRKLRLCWLLSLLLTTKVLSMPLDSMQKVGEAKLEVWFFDVYVSKLYTATGRYQEGEYPIALKIRYLRDIDADDLVEQTGKEWKKLGLLNDNSKQWMKELQGLWPNIKENDELLFHVTSSDQGQFYFNGEAIGGIDDSAFAEQFLAIWLDERCSYPKLRKKLIGQG